MLRNLLSATAIIAIISAGSVYAQDSTISGDQTTTMSSDMSAQAEASSGAPIFPQMNKDGLTENFFDAVDGQVLASSLLGWPVYNVTKDQGDVEQVGDINDIVMGSDGQATAAVIGVGGFLGMGEKNVAVSFGRLAWKTGAQGNWLMINATREDLEKAPAFDVENGSLIRVGAIDADAMKEKLDTASDTVKGAANNAYNKLSEGMSGAADTTSNAVNDMTNMVENAADGAADMNSPVLDGMSPVALETVPFADLKGAEVLSADNKKVGSVSEVITHDDQSEDVLIVDVGGFLGLGQKPVAISATAVKLMSNGHDYVVKTGFDRETLKNHKAYSAEDLSKKPDAVLLK